MVYFSKIPLISKNIVLINFIYFHLLCFYFHLHFNFCYLKLLVFQSAVSGTRKLTLRYQWFEMKFDFDISGVDYTIGTADFAN